MVEWIGFLAKLAIILMYLLMHSGDIYVAFLGVIIKWLDISLPPQWATRSTASQKLWVYALFLLSWNVLYEMMTWLWICYDQFL